MFHSFDTAQAEKFGIEAAIVINHLQFWIRKNAANGKHQHDGRTWTYNTSKAYDELFPYMSKGAAKRALDALRKDGVIIGGNFNTNGYDRTLWYAFADEAAFDISTTLTKNPEDALSKNDPMHYEKNDECIHKKEGNALSKNEAIDLQDFTNGFPKFAESLYSTVTDQISNHSSPKKQKVEKSESRIPTTENALRFHKAYNRQENTAWSQKEVDAFKALGNVSFEDVDLVCRYTEAEKAKGRDERGELKGFHRRDLVTLLNNFAGELDKARDRYAAKTPVKPLETPKEDPERYRQYCEETNTPYKPFAELRWNWEKDNFWTWRNRNHPIK